MITGKQKKFIRKNARNLSLDELSEQLEITPRELQEYLKRIWRKDKFDKYSQKTLPVSSPPVSFVSWLKNNWRIILGLIFLVFIIYINGLNGAFVSDDVNWIPKNPNIGNFKAYFQINNRPAIWIIYYLIHLLGGINPFFYRLPNLIFHIGNTITIFYLLNLLINKRVAIFTSLIIAVHPILVESVTWIAGGSYAAYTFFFLLSFIFYLFAKKKAGLYFFTFIFLLISLSFSEKGVVLFLMFPLYEIAFGSLKKMWKFFLPFLAVGLLVAIILINQIGGKVIGLKIYNYVQPGYDNPLLKIPIAVTEYLRLIVWPSDLSLYRNELSFTWLEFSIRAGIFLIFLLIIFFSYRKQKNIFFWLSLFIISLLPTLTPLRIASVVAERYVYLGSIGIFTVIGIIFDYLSQNEKLRKSIYIIFAVTITALSIRTMVRNHDWANEDNLWVASAKVSPNDPNVLNNLGDMYGRHEDYQKAIESFSLAIKLKPDYADAYHNLANIQTALYLKEKKEEYLKSAIDNYLQAIKYNPLLWQSHQNLAIIYFNIGKSDKAVEEITQAIKINPTNPDLQNNLEFLKQTK